MTNNVWQILQLIFVVILIGFLGVLGYKYYVYGEIERSYVTPIVIVTIFYLLAKYLPKKN